MPNVGNKVSKKSNVMQKQELKKIIDQIERLYSNNWTGININLILGEIDDDIANTELPFFTNTIHQIARHLIADDFLVIKRLQGIDYILSKEEDWIPTNKLKSVKWSDTKNALIKSKNELVKSVQSLDDSDLDKPILKDNSTVYVNLHGHIQHAYYHFGQISQIKKAIENLNKK